MSTVDTRHNDSESDQEQFVDALDSLNVTDSDRSTDDIIPAGSSGTNHDNPDNHTPASQASTSDVNQDPELSTEGEGCKSEIEDPLQADSKKNQTKLEEMDDFFNEVEDAENGGSEDESDDKKPVEEDYVDEELLKEEEARMTDDEKQEAFAEAQKIKREGNVEYLAQKYTEAIEIYTRALRLCPTCFDKERSMMYSNRAAAKAKLDRNDDAILDCDRAIGLNPQYIKALIRRAELLEKVEKYEGAAQDYLEVTKLDPSYKKGYIEHMRLQEKAKEQNERMKAEMMDKLKDLGNMVLRPFGLSTNNFQFQQDPNTGGYSVQFNQNTS